MTAPNTTLRFSDGSTVEAFDPRRQPVGTRNLESPWRRGPGRLPNRVVMHRHDGDVDGWATHLEVEHEDGHRSTCWGHYGLSYAEAIDDYLERVQKLRGRSQ